MGADGCTQPHIFNPSELFDQLGFGGDGNWQLRKACVSGNLPLMHGLAFEPHVVVDEGFTTNPNVFFPSDTQRPVFADLCSRAQLAQTVEDLAQLREDASRHFPDQGDQPAVETILAKARRAYGKFSESRCVREWNLATPSF